MIKISDDVKHYGVKGMRWGIRKERPIVGIKGLKKTPEIEKMKSTMAKRQKRAQKYTDRAEEAKDRLSDIRKNGLKSKSADEVILGANKLANQKSDVGSILLYGKTRKQLNEDLIKRYEKEIRVNEENASATLNGRLSKNQKIAIGAAVVVAVGATAYIVAKKHGATAALSSTLDAVDAENLGYKNLNRNAYKINDAGQKIDHRRFMQRFMASDAIQNTRSLDIRALSDDDVHVPMDTIFSRISADPEKTMRNNVYASFHPDDVNRYKGILPTYFDWVPKDGAYQVDMRANKNISAPSHKKRVQAFIDLLKEDGDFRHNYALNDASDFTRAGEKYYNQFAREYAASDTTLGTKYFKKLQDMGYNAWVDDNDRGKLSNMPMVVFNARDTLERVSATKLSPTDIDNALASLKEITDRIN